MQFVMSLIVANWCWYIGWTWG